MTESNRGLMRTTSLKLQRMLCSRRGRDASPAVTRRTHRRNESHSRTGLDMPRTPVLSSASSATSYRSSEDEAFHTTTTSSSASTHSASSSSSRSSNRHSHVKRPTSHAKPVLQASTFEWTWNWDDDWSTASFSEVAPMFPRTLARHKCAHDVSPLSSAVDLTLYTLTTLPNRMLDDEQFSQSSFFSDDDDDQQHPSPLHRSARSSDTRTARNVATAASSSVKRNTRTFTIRRKPPPAFIDPLFASCGEISA
ncbi:conserved hypothetical protein [Sporisorium reilianum SRZ2]|uniref:Uncharacterized protein n=1 Tax=Sporisorium reilianum (strain SRZ2) TaxID=999809 RepID=E6ZW28_SPORE|nr:conserved hypothetical protein [Sporisorium reilianum SRZ2]